MRRMDIAYHLNPFGRSDQYIVDPSNPLGFGIERTDHIFVMDFLDGEWQNPRIQQYKDFPDLNLKPAAKVFNYGYCVFEGAKAHPYRDQDIATFRLIENARRFNKSARILCMPTIAEEIFMEAVHTLLDIERLWMPIGQEDTSLYIRPFMIQTEDALGPQPGNQSKFVVMLSPSGPYFSSGFGPTSLLVQNLFYRGFHGGVGAAKAGGNYAGAARPTELARIFGAKQCLFISPEYKIEEVGASGFGMIEDGYLVLPEITDTIIDSITVRSVEELATNNYLKGIKGATRQEIHLEYLLEGIENNRITDVFGLGTAAVVAPIGEILILDKDKLNPEKIDMLRKGEIYPDELIDRNPEDYITIIQINNGDVGDLTKQILDFYTGIQRGRIPDYFGWMEVVERTEPVLEHMVNI